MPLNTLEEDEEEKQELTLGQATAKEIIVDAAVAAALSNTDDTFTSKENKEWQ